MKGLAVSAEVKHQNSLTVCSTVQGFHSQQTDVIMAQPK